MSLLSSIFGGCAHKRTTFPQTQKRGPMRGTYVACLECGKEFAYDWEQMKVVEPQRGTELERIFELR